MPAEAPDGLYIAVFTPISFPPESSRGPPELPGLIAASVCMASLMGTPALDCISLPRALTTPVVNVWSSPNGLPIAKTDCPTLKFSDIPTGMA